MKLKLHLRFKKIMFLARKPAHFILSSSQPSKNIPRLLFVYEISAQYRNNSTILKIAGVVLNLPQSPLNATTIRSKAREQSFTTQKFTTLIFRNLR